MRPVISGRSGAKEHRTAKRHVAVLIDTSVLVDAERRGDSLEQAIGDADRAISVITAGELLHGVHRARTPPRELGANTYRAST